MKLQKTSCFFSSKRQFLGTGKEKLLFLFFRFTQFQQNEIQTFFILLKNQLRMIQIGYQIYFM